MPVLYKTFQSKKENKEKLKLFHPRVVHVGTVSTTQLAKEIAEYSSLSTGDVKNTIDNLVLVMTKHLQASESVTVEGLGTFGLVLRSRGKGVATAAEVTAAQALLAVRFTPASTKNQDRTTATRALITGVKCVLYNREAIATGGSGSEGSGTEGDGDQGQTPLG